MLFIYIRLKIIFVFLDLTLLYWDLILCCGLNLLL